MKLWKVASIIIVLNFKNLDNFCVNSVSFEASISKWSHTFCLFSKKTQLVRKIIHPHETKVRKSYGVGEIKKLEKLSKAKTMGLVLLHMFFYESNSERHRRIKVQPSMCSRTPFIKRYGKKLHSRKLFYIIPKGQIKYNRIEKTKKYKFAENYVKQNRAKEARKIRMVLAPKGSIHEKKTKEILSDPVKNLPWEISIPFHETITCEHNPYYNFLKAEWAYLDHRKDVRKPCGKIEGGLENYDGKGLKLEGGVDRPRYKKMPYYLDHGVEWRKYNAHEMIRFDMDPDGNQDQTFLETEEDLEYRQWGNWNYNSAKETTQLNTAWRDPVLSKDLSNLIYPWNHKAHENHPIPYGYRGPSGFIPEIRLEWELAARGFFGGYFDDPNWDRIKNYRMTKKLIFEWHELEKAKRQIEKKQSCEPNKKKTKKKNAHKEKRATDQMNTNLNTATDNDMKELERINNRIGKIRMELFGVSSKKKYGSKQIKLINEHALFRAKEILLDYMLDPNHDPDYHLYYLDRQEPMDYEGGGNHRCSEKEIKNKTVVLNLAIYPVKPQHESYSLNMSIEEMAEMYHYFMTEIRGEGRVHNLFEDPVEAKYLCYELKKERTKFPALMSLYKPLWTHNKYGEEFGDSLQQHEHIRKQTNNFSNFAQKWKTKKKQRLTKQKMEEYNFVDDYEYFDEQYDF